MEGGENTRIFVGGLGESVTSNDLRNVFGSFGVIESLDIIRTKGRSFAYLDFSPSSDKSLRKLVSTYNGCVWKGARLRLEKAKEHYLSSLKREWAEDVQKDISKSTNTVEEETKTNFAEKLKKAPDLEKKQLRMFFPRLKKVKSLPFSGTGKHKYSFKRIDVASVPMYFCDCEEHSVIPQSIEEGRNSELDAHRWGLNEEEFNIMDSVMKKLLASKCSENDLTSGIEQINQQEPSIEFSGDQKCDDNEIDTSAEDDNLILNVVTRTTNRVRSSDSREQETVSDNQKAGFNKKQHSKNAPTPNKNKMQKGRTSPPNKKRESLHKEIDEDKFICAIPSGKSNLPTQTNGSLKLLNASTTEKRLSFIHEEEERNMQNHSSGSKKAMESRNVDTESGVKSYSNLSWSQNHSWRELLGNGGKSTWSVSHLLPGNSSLNEKQPTSEGIFYSTEKQILERNEKPQSQSDKIEVGSLGQTGKLAVVKGLTETYPSKLTAALNNSGRGSAWRHKQSWTQLIGESKSSSFSITQLLPGISLMKQEPKILGNIGAANSNGCTSSNLLKEDANECTKEMPVAPAVVKGSDAVPSTMVKDRLVPAEEDKAAASTVGKPHNCLSKQASAVDVSIGETCLFMRSSASLREWAKAKAALSGSRKRKSNDK